MENIEPKAINQENKVQEAQEKDPYEGIFFEINTLMNEAELGCIERLKPLTIREPKEDELYAIIEVFNYQDFGLNYNTVSKEIESTYEELEGGSAIPGLQEHIESFLEGKSTSQEQNQNFDTVLREKLFDFFSRCWKQAGGSQVKIPTYFCFEREDTDKLMDFETKQTFTEEEVVSQLTSKE